MLCDLRSTLYTWSARYVTFAASSLSALHSRSDKFNIEMPLAVWASKLSKMCGQEVTLPTSGPTTHWVQFPVRAFILEPRSSFVSSLHNQGR